MPINGLARNRVAPLGDIVAAPGRGARTGNRGQLHEGTGSRDIVRDHRGKAWLICTLSFKGRRSPQWQPGHYTHLFFLDEAVGFAAGHRPCAECHYPAFAAYRDAWAAAHGGQRPYAREMDSRLHAERVRDRHGRRVLTAMPWAVLPDGVFVLAGQDPAVVVGDHLRSRGAPRSAGPSSAPGQPPFRFRRPPAGNPRTIPVIASPGASHRQTADDQKPTR
jgi:hypothetical protein